MGNSRYIIYGTPSCNYCRKAEDLLTSLDIKYVFLNMEEDVEGIEEAKRYYSWGTIPIILENNLLTGATRLVGGFSDVEKEIGEQNV